MNIQSAAAQDRLSELRDAVKEIEAYPLRYQPNAADPITDEIEQLRAEILAATFCSTCGHLDPAGQHLADCQAAPR